MPFKPHGLLESLTVYSVTLDIYSQIKLNINRSS